MMLSSHSYSGKRKACEVGNESVTKKPKLEEGSTISHCHIAMVPISIVVSTTGVQQSKTEQSSQKTAHNHYKDCLTCEDNQ